MLLNAGSRFFFGAILLHFVGGLVVYTDLVLSSPVAVLKL